MDRRIELFRDLLRHKIPNTFNVHLGGSWQTGEFHIKKKLNNIISYSDVDYTIDGGYDHLVYTAICAIVLEKAADLNIILVGGISLRDRGEWLLLWNKSNFITVEADSEEYQNEFVLFWSWVACIEAILAQNEHSAEGWKRYQVAKFFLRIWRVFTIAKIGPTYSWEDGLVYIKNLINSQAYRGLLKIKKGQNYDGTWNVIRDINLSAIKKTFCAEKVSCANELLNLIQAVVSGNASAQISYIHVYLSHARKLVKDGSPQAAALMRLEKKWNKASGNQLLFSF